MPAGQKCAYPGCGELGHNKRSCPKRKAEKSTDLVTKSRDQNDAPIEKMVDDSFLDALRADTGSGKATDRKGREVVEKASAGFAEKMKSWISKTEKISKTNFVRFHVRMNLLLHQWDIWVYSEPMLEVAKEMNELDLSKAKKEGDIKWLSDPRLFWARDHYDCWNLLYPNALRIPEFGKYAAVGVFFYHTAIILQVKHKQRVLKEKPADGQPQQKPQEQATEPPQDQPEESPA